MLVTVNRAPLLQAGAHRQLIGGLEGVGGHSKWAGHTRQRTLDAYQSVDERQELRKTKPASRTDPNRRGIQRMVSQTMREP